MEMQWKTAGPMRLEDMRKAWWGSSKMITRTTEDTAGITDKDNKGTSM